MVLVFILEIIRYGGHDDCGKIKKKVNQFGPCPGRKYLFNQPSKEIQGKHVKEQVYKISVYEAVGDKTVQLSPAFHTRRVKDQVIGNLWTGKSGNGYGRSYGNDEDSKVKLHDSKISATRQTVICDGISPRVE